MCMEKWAPAFAFDLVSPAEKKKLMNVIKWLCLILQFKREKKSLASWFLLLILKVISLNCRDWLKVNVQMKTLDLN